MSEAVGMDTGGSANRLKALATTAPLHDLDQRKTAVQVADYAIYQMAELAFIAIDLVTLAMDFDTGAKPAEVIAGITRAAAEQAPEREPAEHGRVAAWVLDALLNVGNVDRGFKYVYGTSTADGYQRRQFDFKLLDETHGHDGERYLRSTTEAVNVLVGALDIDIESEQIAADLRLETLISRGKLSDAQRAAQRAQLLTIHYAETLRQKLDATTRDVATVDWLREMPEFLDSALAHIADRHRAETAILKNITEVRDTAETAKAKQQAAALVTVLRDCLRRHGQLQNALQRAGATFRAEQDRQTFTTDIAATDALDLHAQLLVPALELPVADAVGPLDTFFRAAAGLSVPTALRYADLYDALITPPATLGTNGEEISEPELDEVVEAPAFTEDTYDALDEILNLDPQAPARLSGLLEQARQIQNDARNEGLDVADLPLLVVIRVLAQAAQEIGAARVHGDQVVTLALNDGTALDDLEFEGADLLVNRAELVSNTPANPPPDPDDGSEPHPDAPAENQMGAA